MNDPLLVIALIAALLMLIMVIMLCLVLRQVKALSASNIKIDMGHLLQQQDHSLQQGLAESRLELRTVSAENRKEANDLFSNFQEILLKRVTENSADQTRQLDAFRNTINLLSEKLLTNSDVFKQSISVALQTSSDAHIKKQEDFNEKTLSRLNSFQAGIQQDAKENRKELNAALQAFANRFSEGIKDFNEQLAMKFSDLNRQQLEANKLTKSTIIEIKEAIEKQLQSIREDNTRQLNEMRITVDEKLHSTLEKRLGESFKLVSDRLEQVHKGLGEMQSLAVGVGDLKKVLSNVKTRGILGEYQLGNILEQILSPEQYDVNVATKKGSQGNVEFAIKLPGKTDEKIVWLPIDSKFPLESYQFLLNALEAGEVDDIAQAEKQLLKAVENFAKEISSKYIDPPHTTDFAIMFLPVESLYAEVLRHPEIFEKLQRVYRVTITGPTTLSALLNSLHMGFRTLAVQKRSSEVWNVLAEVKTEFGRFSQQLAKVHKQLHTASTSLETLQSTRTHALARKLRSVETLEVDNKPEPMSLIEN